MSELTLYKFCLQKIGISLRDGIHKFCSDNLFKLMPSIIVNDIMSAILVHQEKNGFRMDDLEQILTCGKLQELKMTEINVQDSIPKVKILIKFFNFLKIGCQNLEVLHIPDIDYYDEIISSEEWANAQTEIGECLGNLFENSTNLEDLECHLGFDLKALRNCRKLRRLSLHFEPQQHWYEFLQGEEDHFKTHKHLELFNVCPEHLEEAFPHEDIVVILQHCPMLTSLGATESSGALSQLYGISTSELKLRHCYWYDTESQDNEPHRVKEAVQIFPLIEELDFDHCYSRSIPFLKNLKYPVCLNIHLHHNVNSVVFIEALQEIGPQLKHLCFDASSITDISLLLQNCDNLESLSFRAPFTEFAKPVVRLPNLKRLTLSWIFDDDQRRVFCLFQDCNQLTELFLHWVKCFDDEALRHFLRRNSVLNLKVAFLDPFDLTESGFRYLLLKAPQIEIFKIYNHGHNIDNFKKVISETNHKALISTDGIFEREDFFGKRTYRFEC